MIVVDIETSGTDPLRHSILSIGAVDFSKSERRFYGECRMREGAEYTKEALAVNGFSVKDLYDNKKSTLEGLLNAFALWAEPVEDRTIAGHNVHFDLSFLAHSFGLYRIPLYLGHRVVDTHTLVYAHCLSRGTQIPLNNRRTNIDSTFVFKYVGLDGEPRPHNALNGAKMAAESLSRLLYGKPLLKEYMDKPIPQYLQSPNIVLAAENRITSNSWDDTLESDAGDTD